MDVPIAGYCPPELDAVRRGLVGQVRCHDDRQVQVATREHQREMRRKVAGIDDEGEIVLNDIFSFRRTSTAEGGRVVGEFRATGYLPSYLDEFITQGLIEEGDEIVIDIPQRTIHLNVSEKKLASRRKKMEANGAEAWKPREKRARKVSAALKAYAALTTSADKGAVRNVDQL